MRLWEKLLSSLRTTRGVDHQDRLGDGEVSLQVSQAQQQSDGAIAHAHDSDHGQPAVLRHKVHRIPRHRHTPTIPTTTVLSSSLLGVSDVMTSQDTSGVGLPEVRAAASACRRGADPVTVVAAGAVWTHCTRVGCYWTRVGGTSGSWGLRAVRTTRGQ